MREYKMQWVDTRLRGIVIYTYEPAGSLIALPEKIRLRTIFIT
jgi:hypothetical protein